MAADKKGVEAENDSLKQKLAKPEKQQPAASTAGAADGAEAKELADAKEQLDAANKALEALRNELWPI